MSAELIAELASAREMRRLETERARLLENERNALYRAVMVAREKGEHYPTCNAPPPEIRKLSPSSAEWRAWREANRGKCNCWKAEMEAAMKGA